MSVGRSQGAGQVALEGSSGPFGRGRAVDEVHRRRTAGGGETEHREEREMEVRAFLRFLKFQGPLGNLKNISYLEGSNEKVLNTNFA